MKCLGLLIHQSESAQYFADDVVAYEIGFVVLLRLLNSKHVNYLVLIISRSFNVDYKALL